MLVILVSCAARPGNNTVIVESIGLNEKIVSISWRLIKLDGIQVRQPVTPDNQVGFYTRTHVPEENNNTVLFGHSDIHRRVFRNLYRVETGDEITVRWEGVDHKYVVTQRLIIPENVPVQQKILNARLVMGDTNYKRLTLITCYGAESRLIIFAKGI